MLAARERDNYTNQQKTAEPKQRLSWDRIYSTEKNVPQCSAATTIAFIALQDPLIVRGDHLLDVQTHDIRGKAFDGIRLGFAHSMDDWR